MGLGTGVITGPLNASDKLQFIKWLFTRVALHSCRVEDGSKRFTRSVQKRHLSFTALSIA